MTLPTSLSATSSSTTSSSNFSTKTSSGLSTSDFAISSTRARTSPEVSVIICILTAETKRLRGRAIGAAPQRLKPNACIVADGTTKVVPFPNCIPAESCHPSHTTSRVILSRVVPVPESRPPSATPSAVVPFTKLRVTELRIFEGTTNRPSSLSGGAGGDWSGSLGEQFVHPVRHLSALRHPVLDAVALQF